MKIRALAVAAAAFAWGCGQQVSTYSAASGSLALSSDDALLYAVDSDSDSLFVINAHDESPVAQVKVGHGPEKVIVDRFLSVSFIAALAPAEKARVAARLREVAQTHPKLRGRATIAFPYQTRAYRFGVRD